MFTWYNFISHYYCIRKFAFPYPVKASWTDLYLYNYLIAVKCNVSWVPPTLFVMYVINKYYMIINKFFQGTRILQ